MKELIIKALDDAYQHLITIVPQTKPQSINSESIRGLTVSELIKFAKDNNMPEYATIELVPNSYDGFEDVVLSYCVPIPTTEKDNVAFIKRKFNNNAAWYRVYNTLTANGYKRVGYNTGLLKPFDKTTVYDMYMNKEFDRLVEYYSLPFKKED